MRKRPGTSEVLIAGVTSASLLCGGCGGDAKKWKNAPGTQGFINMNAVKEAFQKNDNLKAFEKRINEVYEGDNLLVVESERRNAGFRLTAYEDLNSDKKVDKKKDDTVFVLTVTNGTAQLVGHGVNSYFKESWKWQGATKDWSEEKEQQIAQEVRQHRNDPYYRPSYMPFFFMYHSAGWNRYYTPPAYYDNLSSHRKDYRSSSAFTKQIKNNAKYETKMSKKYGTKFTKAATKSSSVRKNYVKKTSSSRNFKSRLAKSKSSSGWGRRASSGTKSSFSSSRGGGRFGGSSGFGA